MKALHRIKICDLLLAAVILTAAVIVFLLPFFADKAAYAEIFCVESGDTYDLSLEYDIEKEIVSRGVTLTVSVEDGSISVSASNCRDGICKNTPPISRAGQSIVCAPAGVVISIIGKEDAVDGVAG